MKGMKTLVGVESGEMAAGLFPPAPLEGRVVTATLLKQKLQEIAEMSPEVSPKGGRQVRDRRSDSQPTAR